MKGFWINDKYLFSKKCVLVLFIYFFIFFFKSDCIITHTCITQKFDVGTIWSPAISINCGLEPPLSFQLSLVVGTDLILKTI